MHICKCLKRLLDEEALVIYAQTGNFVKNLQDQTFDNKRQTEFFPVSWTSASEALRIYDEFYIQIETIVEHLFWQTNRENNYDNKYGGHLVKALQ